MFSKIRSRYLFGGVGRSMIDGYSNGRVEGGTTVDELLNYQGILRLARLGPFMPPMTAPDPNSPCRVVTQHFRKVLEESALTSTPIEYREVIKEHIVEFHWESWDRRQDFPDVEFDCAPEQFIEAQLHSPSAAVGLGEIWEARFPVCKCLRTSPTSQQVIALSKWDGSHLFAGRSESSRQWGGLYADDIGRNWLQDRMGEFIDFEEVHAE